MTITTLFDDNWEFIKTDLATTLESARTLEGWQQVAIPHDWLIYDCHNLYENSMGYYRKKFTVEKNADCEYVIRFEAVYQDSEIFMNGKKVGEWKYGYNTFEVDVTDALVSGENLLEVAVRYESPNSRWYSGAGIYRDVYWVERGAVHIATDGVYVRTKKVEAGYEVRVSTELVGVRTKQILKAEYQIHDEDGELVAQCLVDVTDETTVIGPLQVKEWSIDACNLYTLSVRILNGEEILDESTVRFGFRTMEFTTDRGFFLNGEHVKIQGVCIHHDLGALGAAFHTPALKRQLQTMKEMGVNALRTSHNMPARELLDLADEMGFLVNDEMFDMWRLHKTEHDYAGWFDTWAARDIANFVRRDRNHASLMMWSVGNEIYDTHADLEDGLATIRMLRDETKRHDPESNGVVTFASNYMEGDPTQTCADELRVVGYNYLERLYENHHKKHPNWTIYGSETASTVQSRGIYHFPLKEQILVDVDEQCSALGNSTTSWGAANTEACILAERNADYSMGQFIWTGYDYIGEPTPYHTKNSYYGQVDTAGFPKDSYYIYQAEWTDYKKKPMVHLYPYWDFNPGQLIDVRVTSNAPEIELFLNGTSQGVKQIDHLHGTELVGHWQLTYEPGVLEAVAYDENHVEIARDVQHSYGDAVAITSHTESSMARADGRDLYFIEIGMADENGHPVQNANNRVHVSVEGPGVLVGLDNGDSTDYESYKGTSKKLFAGKLLAMIATTKKAGYIVVTISSEGMADHKIYLTAEDAKAISGSCVQTPNTVSEPNAEIPIRKIEIRSREGLLMNPSCTEISLEAVLYPKNCTYEEITWMAVNDAGVTTNLVQLSTEGTKATVKAMGDGHINVRCIARNGGEKVNVLSSLGMDIEGIGSAYINPYELVSASLYDVSEGEMQKALEHGIATARDGASYLGFKNVDFGDFGSSQITLPCFAFNSMMEYRIRIWSGIPNEEGSECLVDGIYQKQTIWDTYIPETYTFRHRIKGIHTICIQTEQFINIKGFICERENKGTSQVFAIENNKIYGDEFTVGEDAITGIGNNVAIEFHEMDFHDGVSKLTMCGLSHKETNTIHIRFEKEDGTFTRQMIEFAGTPDYDEQTFDLEKVEGLRNVTLIFLPGSSFDLKWIQFK